MAQLHAADMRAVLDTLSLRYRHVATPCIVRLSKHAQARHLRLIGSHSVLECAPLTQLVLAVSAHSEGASTLLSSLLRPPSRAQGSNEVRDHSRAQRLAQLAMPAGLVGAAPLDAALRFFSTAGVVLAARCEPGPAGERKVFPLLGPLGDAPLRADEELIVIASREALLKLGTAGSPSASRDLAPCSCASTATVAA